MILHLVVISFQTWALALSMAGPQFLDPISLIGSADREALPRAPLALRWPTHPAPLGAVLLRALVSRHCRRVSVLRQLPCPGRARSLKESRAREHVRRRRRQHLHRKWTASQLLSHRASAWRQLFLASLRAMQRRFSCRYEHPYGLPPIADAPNIMNPEI